MSKVPLPELIKYSVEKKLSAFCESRIPLDIRDKVRLFFKLRGQSATLIETRPYFRDPSIWTESPVAQFRFDLDDKVWRLCWCDRNSRWHAYDRIKPSANFDALLAEVDRDPTGIFWG